MNEYRHVCFKDLENYVKRDEYFGNLSEAELEQIRHNLNVPSKTEAGNVCEGTYADIKRLVDQDNLNLGSTYVITDFQTIYKCDDEVWGLEVQPSQVYKIILTPASSNSFNPVVSVLKDDVVMPWEVRYSFTPEAILDGIYTKGKITYLKDEKNNSAYYDFKNIKFKKTLLSSEVSGLIQDSILPMYTFSSLVDGVCVENSSEAINNQFDQDCYGNVFMGNTKNNHFYGGFKNNLFIKDCQYNTFEWNTVNNKFTESVQHTKGTLQNATVNSTQYDTAINKEFKMVSTLNAGQAPVFVVTYIDGNTLTNQVTYLNVVE